jgi:hypothetical protein
MPYCCACGVANIAAAEFCKSCGGHIAVPIINVSVVAPDAPVASAAPVVPAVTVTQAMAAAARLPLRSPFIAGLLSALWPGAGQLYTGRAVGLAQMICVPCGYAALLFAAFFSLALGEFLIALLLVLATLWGWMKVIEDAGKGAQRINAVRTSARATVRAARGAGYAPSSSPAAIWNAPTRTGMVTAKPQPALIGVPVAVKYSPATLPALVFIGVCAIVLIVEIVSSYV